MVEITQTQMIESLRHLGFEVMYLEEAKRLHEVEAAALEVAKRFRQFAHFMKWEPEAKLIAELQRVLSV